MRIAQTRILPIIIAACLQIALFPGATVSSNTKNSDRLFKPQQHDYAALRCGEQRLLSRRGLGGRAHSGQSAAWGDGSHEWRCLLHDLLCQHFSRHSAGTALESYFDCSQEGNVFLGCASGNQRHTRSERQKTRRGDGTRNGPTGRRGAASLQRIQSRPGATARYRRDAVKSTSARIRSGSSRVGITALRPYAAANGL